MTDENTLDAGTNVSQSQDNGVATGTPDTDTTQTKAKSGAAKLLAQRNEARRKAEEFERENADLKSQLDQIVDQRLEQRLNEKALKDQKNEFVQTFGEEELAKVEALRDKHPSLDYYEAYTLANPGEVAKKGQQFNVQGNVPTKSFQEVSAAELSDAEVEAAAKRELEGMGIVSRF